MLNVFKPVQRGAEQSVNLHGQFTGVNLQVVIHPGEAIYIEWPDHEPMENVIAAIHQTERGVKGKWRAVFDMSDDDLLEVLVGGFRLHGMFAEDLITD